MEACWFLGRCPRLRCGCAVGAWKSDCTDDFGARKPEFTGVGRGYVEIAALARGNMSIFRLIRIAPWSRPTASFNVAPGSARGLGLVEQMNSFSSLVFSPRASGDWIPESGCVLEILKFQPGGRHWRSCPSSFGIFWKNKAGPQIRPDRRSRQS